MKEKEILLVSDFVGIGKVALSMMIPIVNAMKARASYLPTSIVSNNFDYGNVYLEDLTEYMEKTVDVWKDINFQFDVVTTGIIMNPKQVDIVMDLVESQQKRPLIISDPIMGDEGDIYPGLDPNIVEASRKMAIKADIIVPNLTEFCLITGKEYPKDIMSHEKMVKYLEKARSRGVKSAVITSVKNEDGYFVYGFEEDEEIFYVEYEYIPVEVGGTGDLFTSLLIGKYVQNEDLIESVEYATDVVTHIIRQEYKKGITGATNEIQIQNYLQYIDGTL